MLQFGRELLNAARIRWAHDPAPRHFSPGVRDGRYDHCEGHALRFFHNLSHNLVFFVSRPMCVQRQDRQAPCEDALPLHAEASLAKVDWTVVDAIASVPVRPTAQLDGSRPRMQYVTRESAQWEGRQSIARVNFREQSNTAADRGGRAAQRQGGGRGQGRGGGQGQGRTGA